MYGNRGSVRQGKSIKTFLFMSQVKLAFVSGSTYEWKQKGAVEGMAGFVLQ
jgi:hypothetical protein